jgi:hypothetical protein
MLIAMLPPSHHGPLRDTTPYPPAEERLDQLPQGQGSRETTTKELPGSSSALRPLQDTNAEDDIGDGGEDGLDLESELNLLLHGLHSSSV